MSYEMNLESICQGLCQWEKTDKMSISRQNQAVRLAINKLLLLTGFPPGS